MRHSLSLVAFLALTACAAAPFGTPQPQSAKLSQQTLTLSLTDGTICRVNWANAPVGRMDQCGPGYGYAVRIEQNPNVLSQLFSGLTGALGAEGAGAPLGEVVITDPAGIDHVFVSPPSVEFGPWNK